MGVWVSNWSGIATKRGSRGLKILYNLLQTYLGPLVIVEHFESLHLDLDRISDEIVEKKRCCSWEVDGYANTKR